MKTKTVKRIYIKMLKFNIKRNEHVKVNEPRYKRGGVTPHFPKTKK